MRTFLAAAVLLAAVSCSMASMPELGFWAGYTTFGMNSVNNFLSDAAGSGGSVTKVSGGYLIAADLLYPLDSMPDLSLGPRIEYAACNQGKASNATTSITIDQYIIPILVGGSYRLTEKDKLKLTGKLFLGLGLGYATADVKTTSGGTVTDASNSYSGSGLAADIGVGGAYRASESVNIGLDLAYRYADMGSMGTGGYGGGGGSSGSGGGGYTYAPSRASLTNPVSGSSVTYDFSGLAVNLGVTYKFQ